jgi:hypothetical protein
MAIPSNVVIGWAGSAASIPVGWVRETRLDSMYVVGAATSADADPTTSRGNASHIHTSPAHAPIQDAHTHNFFTIAIAGNVRPLTGGSPLYTSARNLHDHTGTSSAATAVNDSVTITVDATANDLAYTSVIWIKSTGIDATFPVGCVAFWMDDAIPVNWSRTLGGKYLKGASAAADGGSSGGSNTHTHTSPAHTHTIQDHQHVAAASSGPDFTSDFRASATTVSITDTNHYHNVSLDFGSGATNQSTTTTISTSNHEPPYIVVNAITAIAPDLPIGIVALWLGANASIPSGWSRVTALDGKWIKAASANGQVTTTGGATAHTHTASSCQPVQDPHNHLAFGSAPQPSGTKVASGTGFSATITHTHDWDTDVTTATNQAASVSIDNSADGDAYPPYRTAIFIRFASSGPTVSITGATSYDIPQWQSIEGKVLPEVAARIAHGDRRFYPEAL